MKIADADILILNHSGAMGGAEWSLLDVVESIKNECSVCVFEDGPLVDALGLAGVSVTVKRAPRRTMQVRRHSSWVADIASVLSTSIYAAQIAYSARRSKVIYTNSQKAFVVGALASLLSRRPHVWHQRDILSESHFGGSHIRLVRILANHATTLIIANSSATHRSLRSNRITTAIETVYNGVKEDPDHLYGPSPVLEFRHRHPQTRAVGVFSRLAPWKGQDSAIRAIARLPGVALFLVGGALFGEEAYEQELRNLINQLHLEGRVFIVSHSNHARQMMSDVDVICHTSRAPEAFGRVIVEGMLAGRPVIASRGGAVEELIVQGQSGIIVDPDDPVQLADAIESLLSDARYASLIANTGRERARQNFTSPRMQRRMREILTQHL